MSGPVTLVLSFLSSLPFSQPPFRCVCVCVSFLFLERGASAHVLSFPTSRTLRRGARECPGQPAGSRAPGLSCILTLWGNGSLVELKLEHICFRGTLRQRHPAKLCPEACPQTLGGVTVGTLQEPGLRAVLFVPPFPYVTRGSHKIIPWLRFWRV